MFWQDAYLALDGENAVVRRDNVELARFPVLTHINNGVVTGADFETRESGAAIMTDGGRKKLLSAWQERKRVTLTHPYTKEKLPWGLIPYMQALLLARYLRGNIDGYPPFLWK